MNAIQFNGIHHQVIGGWVAGQQQQVVVHDLDVPCTIDGRRRSLRYGVPCSSFVQHHQRRNCIGTNSQKRLVSSDEVKSVFIDGAAGLCHGVRLPCRIARPLFVDIEGPRGIQRSNEDGAVGQRGQCKLSVKVRLIGDGLGGKVRTIVHPQRQIRSIPVIFQ